ncbi:MAG: DedA family protein [Gammaproteobacteria bacterium SHHR-1]|uniref:DedA family protein n=1 Tax=Magnetovirga frankeli TaxID=947516 RepID=UPI001293E031|nr:DedA family protein [gamma proteobacterium SS-5]
MDLINPLIDWIGTQPQWAGWVVFAVALAESLALVGVLIPGVLVLFAVGTLVGAGVLDFWAMCAYAAAGAIIGDGLSYWLGHRLDAYTGELRWFRLHPDQLQKGIAFFARYGDLSVALGRFFGPIRAIIPLVAGLMHMPPRRFYAANILSALVWAPAYLLPGTLVGQAASDGDWLKLAIPLVGVALVVLVWWLVQRYRYRG